MIQLKHQSVVTYFIWAALLIAAALALFTARWEVAFVALATLAASLAPLVAASRFGVLVPRGMIAASTFFIFATLFLGEVFNFYERYWWWDIFLHGFSALGFGLLGFLYVFIMFEGDRYAAPAGALGLIAFCVAVTIGALWEIFEFLMDLSFGLNMQKSGLNDTMGDLIVDVIGAGIGGIIATLFVKGRAVGGATALMDEFVRLNKKWFGRFRDR